MILFSKSGKFQGILFLATHGDWERVSFMVKAMLFQKTSTKELVSVVSSPPGLGKNVSSMSLKLVCGQREVS